MILFSANNSLCGEGNSTSRSDDLIYFRELDFRKPRLSNSIVNLSSPSPLEIERNQRKTSDSCFFRHVPNSLSGCYTNDLRGSCPEKQFDL